MNSALKQAIGDGNYLGAIEEVTGVPLRSATAYGVGPDASFELELADGSTVALNASQFQSWAAWSKVAMTAPGGQTTEAPTKNNWVLVRGCLKQILVVVSDPDALERAESLTWVQAALESAVSIHGTDGLGEALAQGWAFRRDGELFVKAAEVAETARTLFKARPKGSEITRRLRGLGFEPRDLTAMHDGRKLCRTVWGIDAATFERLDSQAGGI